MEDTQETAGKPQEVWTNSYSKESWGDDSGGMARINAALKLGVEFHIYPEGKPDHKGNIVPEGQIGTAFIFENREDARTWNELSRNWSTQGADKPLFENKG